MTKKKKSSGSIKNKRARFDYELSDTLIVGIELSGSETKNLRLGHGQLRGSYVTIKDDELYLILWFLRLLFYRISFFLFQ